MKKSILYAAAVAVLASCSNEGFIGDVIDNTSDGAITFSQTIPNVTRAVTSGKDAAQKLGNNFIVYGYKIAKDSNEALDASKDKLVFDLYNVDYADGTANTTGSNTSGWEYVGKTSEKGAAQTVKYWDYSAKQYVFSAISCGAGVTATKITNAATIAGTTLQDKGWQLTVPAGRAISDIYASERKVIDKPTPAGTKYGDVKFTFYSLATRIRFALYETVPGYNVKIDKCYYNQDAATPDNTAANFAVDGTFKGMNTSSATTFIVTYDPSNNKPKLAFSSESTASYMQFGTNIMTVAKIGETSNMATFDKADASYSLILPYQSKKADTPADNVLKLKIDYTLTSTDGSGEEIKIKGATAVIPTQYTQWQNNYSYTYIFKISDNTNGSTGDPSDPSGLYPVTFDACVEETSDNIQETVTTVAEPTFTTYQGGTVVTAQDGYSEGTIAVKIYDRANKTEISLKKSNFKLYTAVSLSGKAITEAQMSNYKNSDIVLTDVSNAIAGYATMDTTTATFTAVVGQTYVAEYTDGSSNKHYKVIKVAGTRAQVVYGFAAYKELACENNLDEIEEGGSFYVTAKQIVGTVEGPVTGAANNFYSQTLAAFTIEETSTPGTYKFTANAGTNGYKTIKINATGDNVELVTVNAYEFNMTDISVIADATDQASISLKVADTIATEIDAFTNFEVTAGLTIVSVADGVVKLTAAKNAESGTIKYKNNGIVVATADVTVKHYSFEAAKSVLNIGSTVSTEKSTDITLKLAGVAVTTPTNITVTAASNVLSSNIPSATSYAGLATIEAGTVAGTATVTAPDDNAIEIEVVNFAVEVTGSSDLTVTFKNNGVAQNAELTVSAGTLSKASGTGVYTWKNAVTDATISYSYKGQTFTLFKKN